MKLIRVIFILLIVSVCCPPCGFAQSARMPLVAEGKYFSVYAYPGFDTALFLSKLDYNYYEYPDTLLADQGESGGNMFSQTLDSLYLEVSDILDLHSYNFHGIIKIVAGQSMVEQAFRAKYGRDFPERSIYFADENTIYISGADVTLGMLGHEMAHAIICHYFVVPPPSKTQEVLAGYVEYSLRKKTGSLPAPVN